VLDESSAAARAVGWPDHIIKATRDQLVNASKAQTQIIEQMTELWKKQLESPTSRMPSPMRLFDQMQRGPGTPNLGSMPEAFGMAGQPFAPMLLWFQAAEMWQRQWMSAMSLWADALAFPPPQDDRSAEQSRSAYRH
jgi:hypothetical protein